jgi:hypothetical protein
MAVGAVELVYHALIVLAFWLQLKLGWNKQVATELSSSLHQPGCWSWKAIEKAAHSGGILYQNPVLVIATALYVLLLW